MAARLKEEYIKKIQADTKIFGLIADNLGVRPVSMPVVLNRNNALTEFSTLKIISEYFKVKPEELIEESNTVETMV